MALKSLRMSWPSSLKVELSEEEELAPVLAGGGGGGGAEEEGAGWLWSLVRADCAEEMSLLERAVETLEMNWPSGLLESALEGDSCSIWAR